jgi:hypothetical protein
MAALSTIHDGTGRRPVSGRKTGHLTSDTLNDAPPTRLYLKILIERHHFRNDYNPPQRQYTNIPFIH